MDQNLQFIIAVVELVGKYGIPAVQKIMQNWKTEGEPTEADIQKLREMVPPTDSYFTDS